MLSFIKKNKLPLIILFFLSILYFALRLPNLTLQPIFADEAIYIRWAQVMKAEPTLRFLPLSDGKTPLFMWTLMPLFKIFPDPLFAGRILSIFSGFVTFLGAIFLGWKFFGKTTAAWSGFLIVVTPMIVFFDRMALVDSMLSAFSMWALIFSLLLIKNPRLDLSLILGFILGGGYLTKTPGMFNFLSIPAVFFIFNLSKTNLSRRLFKTIGLFLISILIGLFIYNLLRLGPGFSSLSLRNQDYIFSVSELLPRPLDPFIPHFNDLVDWLPKIITIPILMLILSGIALSIVLRNRAALAVCAWALIPLLIEMTFLRTFTARYILFSIPPLLTVAAWVISEIDSKLKMKSLIKILIFLLLLLPQATYFNYYSLTDPSKAPLPKSERRGYLEDWTAGYGLGEIAEYLRSQAGKGEIIVGTQGAFGTLPEGLQIYLDKNLNVKIAPSNKDFPRDLRRSAKHVPTFYVANTQNLASFEKGFELIKDYPKPEGFKKPPMSILLFKVLPAE